MSLTSEGYLLTATVEGHPCPWACKPLAASSEPCSNTCHRGRFTGLAALYLLRRTTSHDANELYCLAGKSLPILNCSQRNLYLRGRLSELGIAFKRTDGVSVRGVAIEMELTHPGYDGEIMRKYM